MPKTPLIRHLLIAILVLSLPGQALAALMLPCAHSGSVGDGAPAVCHSMLPAGGQDAAPEPVSQFDCQKCVLTAICAVYDLPQPSGPVALPAPGLPDAVASNRHFYRFIPDLLKRPPITRPL